MFESNNTPFTMPVMPANGGYGNNGAWGEDGAWWIIIFVLFFAFGGWGGNGWGGNGSNSSYYTDSALQRGFDTQSIIGKLDGINNGLCDGFYAVNNGMLTGFNGVNTNILQTGYGIQQAINADTVAGMQNANALQAQLAQCCCDTREAIQGVNYNMATNTCALQNTMNNNTRDIIDNQNAGTRAILDYLCQKETADLRAENQALKLAASQSNQNAVLQAAMDANKAEILLRTAPLPVPAYPASNLYGYYGNGCTTGTGCC